MFFSRSTKKIIVYPYIKQSLRTKWRKFDLSLCVILQVNGLIILDRDWLMKSIQSLCKVDAPAWLSRGRPILSNLICLRFSTVANKTNFIRILRQHFIEQTTTFLCVSLMHLINMVIYSRKQSRLFSIVRNIRSRLKCFLGLSQTLLLHHLDSRRDLISDLYFIIHTYCYIPLHTLYYQLYHTEVSLYADDKNIHENRICC